jgi:hypothetical protein
MIAPQTTTATSAPRSTRTTLAGGTLHRKVRGATFIRCGSIFRQMRIAPTTGAPCSSHGRLRTAATLTPPRTATTTVTWWGHRTHGATIGTVAASVIPAATRLTIAKQPQAIGCAAARFSRIVPRSSWLKKAAMQHPRLLLQFLLPRSWNQSLSLNLNLSQNQRQRRSQSQSQRRPLQKAVPALENLALILRIAVRNGALVV